MGAENIAHEISQGSWVIPDPGNDQIIDAPDGGIVVCQNRTGNAAERRRIAPPRTVGAHLTIIAGSTFLLDQSRTLDLYNVGESVMDADDNTVYQADRAGDTLVLISMRLADGSYSWVRFGTVSMSGGTSITY